VRLDYGQFILGILITWFYSLRGDRPYRGADVAAKDENGWTALHWAAVGGHKDVVELLLNKGADVTAEDTDGLTALDLAEYGGHKEVFTLLLLTMIVM
jgi:ankyrin repeat protein